MIADLLNQFKLGVMYKIYNGLVQRPIIKTKLVPPPLRPGLTVPVDWA